MRKGILGKRGDPLISLQKRLQIKVCLFERHACSESFDKKVTCFPFGNPLEPSREPHSYKYVEWKGNPTSTAQYKSVPPTAQIQPRSPLFFLCLCNCAHAHICYHKTIKFNLYIKYTEIRWIPLSIYFRDI